MFKLPERLFWDRCSSKKHFENTHLLRNALRNYIDVLYNNPNPESIEKAYRELKEISPGIEKELELKIV